MSGTKKRLPLMAITICLALSVAAPAAAAPAPMPAEISIGTHGLGSSFYSCGAGFAKVISDHSQLRVVAKPFAGPTAWLPLLKRGVIQVGYLSLIEGVWAYTADPTYAVDVPELRLLLTTNWNRATMGLIVRADSSIKKAADLRGKRVASGYGGTLVSARQSELFLRLGGLTLNDVVRVPVPSVVEGWKALREGRVDAAYGGHPGAAGLLEIDSAIKIRPLPFEQPANWRQIVAEIMPVAEPEMVKAGLGFIREDILLFKHPIGLVVSSQVSEQAVKEIVKVLWVNYKELYPVHPWLKDMDPETMTDLKPKIPYHAGTVSWFKEQKLWNAEVEQIQKTLLDLRKQK
jgi:uncharacterized protein